MQRKNYRMEVIRIEVFDIYLAGKCRGLSEEEQNKWRNDIKTYLESYENSKYKINVINPNKYFNYFRKLHKNNKQIKEYYMSRIDRCRLVIVNLDDSDSSVGTGQELEHARMKGVPIIGFGTKNMYPWEVEVDCQVVFDNIDECLDYVVGYYIE